MIWVPWGIAGRVAAERAAASASAWGLAAAGGRAASAGTGEGVRRRSVPDEITAMTPGWTCSRTT